MTIVVEQAEATTGLEAVYREDGARLWRALYAYSNDASLPPTRPPRRSPRPSGGTAIRDLRGSGGQRFACGALPEEPIRVAPGPVPDGVTHDFHLDDELVVALQGLTPQQRLMIVLHY